MIRLRTNHETLMFLTAQIELYRSPRFGGQSRWLKCIVWAILDLVKQSLVKHNNKKYLNCFSTANMTRFAAWDLMLLWSLIMAPLHYTFLLKAILLTKLQINESKRPVVTWVLRYLIRTSYDKEIVFTMNLQKYVLYDKSYIKMNQFRSSTPDLRRGIKSESNRIGQRLWLKALYF